MEKVPLDERHIQQPSALRSSVVPGANLYALERLQHPNELDRRRLLARQGHDPSSRLIQQHVVLFGQLPRNKYVLDANSTIFALLLATNACSCATGDHDDSAKLHQKRTMMTS